MTKQQESLRQLQWMRSNLPTIPGETVTLKDKRRKSLRGILSRIRVDQDGCMLYGYGQGIPKFAWPTFNPNSYKSTDYRAVRQRGEWKTCQWPEGCSRPPLPRASDRGKWPKYCDEDGHNPRGISALNERVKRAEKRWPKQYRPIPHLLLELYADGEVPARVYPTCRKYNCVHPGHQSDQLNDPVTRAKLVAAVYADRKLSTEDVREIVRSRGEGATVQEMIAKYGVSDNCIAMLTNGKERGRETADLRAKYKGQFRDGRKVLTPELARGIVQMKLDFPELTMAKIADKFGLKEHNVRNVLHADGYAKETADLRAQLPKTRGFR